MDSVTDRLNKLREERIAREKARIEKLRELNLKKYSKQEEPFKNSMSNLSTTSKSVKSEVNLQTNSTIKNNFHVNGTTKRPIMVPTLKPQNKDSTKPKTGDNLTKTGGKSLSSNIPKASAPNVTKKLATKQANAVNTDRKLYTSTTDKKVQNNDKKVTHISQLPKSEKQGNRSTALNGEKKQNFAIRKTESATTNLKLQQSLAVTNNKPNPNVGRKSMIPQSASKSTSQCSVFERLYKPKTVPTTKSINDVEKLHNDPSFLKKVISNSEIILNKRHTVFEHNKPKVAVPVRRSISAVHFKRINKQELGNCIHKWSSIGDKLNNMDLTHVNEDENIQADKVVSAVKSERKKVTFMTPMANLNTPRPEELQARLKSWLQKRGKSLSSYHHLQCFGIHHLPHSIKFDNKVFDDENKENIAVESDSDNDSYMENMNEKVQSMEEWRTASCVSDSVDFNESHVNDITLTSSDVNLDDVAVCALKDLTELLREGFDWEQCARWLRAIRERLPSVPNSAEYWECRAALEDRRGDLPASVQCWEEAIAKGTEHSVVEANLDQLLDKFMQLKISPTSGKQCQANPKLVDVKNVFKSTIIRFAVQQAKLRNSTQFETPKFTITPVRRSGRLSTHCSGHKRTPLQVCTSVRQADELVLGEKPVFVPNGSLYGTP